MLVNEILTEELHGLIPEESKYFEKVLQYIRKELNIPNTVTLDVAFKPGIKFDPGQSGLTIPNPTKPNHIFVFLSPGLTNGERVQTLAHEMIHVQHIVSGKMTIELKDGKYFVTWENKPVQELVYSRSHPWEVDAHSKDRDLAHRVIKQIGNLI
jgi:hypothetical protein